MKTEHHIGALNVDDIAAALLAAARVFVWHAGGIRWDVATIWPGGMGPTDRVWFRWRADRQAARRRREVDVAAAALRAGAADRRP